MTPPGGKSRTLASGVAPNAHSTDPARPPGAFPINWGSRLDRWELLARIGDRRFQQLLEAHRRECIVEVVNGYTIRRQRTSRGVEVFFVSGLRVASATLAGARELARTAKAPRRGRRRR